MIKNILSTLILCILIFGKVQAQSIEICIHSALKNSPLLYDYNIQLQAGRIDSLLIIVTFKPQVNQVAMYARHDRWFYHCVAAVAPSILRLLYKKE